jgi:Asp-tRNA(Asn)/Glu-tRNA(Gln) amidotransferase A subunit family amidase
MVSAAIGTDGAGSIRIPASYCGIVGLKPTWGAVSERGCTSSYSSMAVTGPMARNAEDCRIVAETLLGHSLSPTNRALRIGIVEGELWNDVEPDVARECRDALGRLEATGATVQQVELEHLQQVVICSVLKMSSERLPLIGPDWLEQMGDDLHPFVRGLLLARQLTTAPTIARIDRMRGALRRTLQTAFRSVDVLVWPTAPSIAPLVDHPVVDLPSGRTSVDLANVRHTGLANLTGVPAITVPCRTNGMPVGLMAHAAWGREDLLFSFAERTEV